MATVMSLIVAAAISAVLFALALVHVYWGCGGLWPARSEQELVETVIGTPGMHAMPEKLVTLSVAAGIFLAGLWPLFWLELIPFPLPRLMLISGMVGLVTVFLLRGAVTYAGIFGRQSTTEPFHTLNRRYFSPLILAIGLAFAYLLIIRWPQ